MKIKWRSDDNRWWIGDAPGQPDRFTIDPNDGEPGYYVFDRHVGVEGVDVRDVRAAKRWAERRVK